MTRSIAMPRICLCLFAMVAVFFGFPAYGQDGSWSAGLPPIAARALGAAATVAGRVYMVGGGNYSCGVTSALQAYETVANSWTNLPNMPTARYEFGATELNGQFYAIAGNQGCGSAGNAIRAVEAFDPSANAWSSKAPLPSGSWDPSVSSVNGKIYVIGGFGNTVYAYDPTANSWSTKTPAPQSFSAGATAVVDGIIYVLGGNQGSQATVQAYNPATDTWTTKASMPTPRYSCAGAALNGYIYVMGGYASTGAVSTVEAYNPAADTWTTVTPLPYRVWAASATALNGTLYLMGGFDTNYSTLGTVLAFTPKTSIAALSMYAGLTIIGPVGSSNRIDYKNDLAATNWTPLSSLVLPVSPLLFIDTNSPATGTRFYRVMQQ
jgi:N-acetylneuraminic acid mutarotase